MKQSVVALFALLLAHTGLADVTQTDIAPYAIGKAYEHKTGRFLYSEHYYRLQGSIDPVITTVVNASPGDTVERVVYKNPSNQVIAEKYLAKTHNAWSPNLLYQHQQTGERYQVQVEHQQSAQINARYQKTGNSPEKAHQLIKELNNSLVVDAGFDPFIQDHWQQLNQGNRLEFSYFLPSRGQLFDLRVESMGQKDSYLSFIIEPVNLLLRQLIDPIELEYNTQGRLMTFFGKSNISDERGKFPHVVIQYQYPNA